MNMKLKTSLIAGMILIAGMVMGAMLNRAFLQQRVQRVFQRRAPNVFVQSYVDAIKPDKEQQKQIEKILEAYARSMSEIREKSRQDLETLMDSMLAELETVLTPEQMERLSERPPVGRPSFGWQPIRGEMDFLSGELNLTEEQSARVKKIIEDFRRPPDKKPPDMTMPPNPEEMAAHFKRQRDKMEQEIEKILNEDQLKIYQDLQKDRRKRFSDIPFE